ncbi:MAG: tRNA lysidine(34) synthetase TilS [Candidatus Sulfotelmatobacter sp.]
MHGLAQRVLAHIQRRELLQAGERVGVAVSGGIDSIALLRLLLELRGELGIVVSVVHFDHKLRGAESDADEELVAKLARDLGVECRADSGDVAAQAAEEHISVETAARELRYGFFRHLLGEDFAADLASKLPRLNKIATGHTLDDQAETVLMRLIRGTGMRGLGGIHPRIPVEREDAEHEHEDGHGEIIRPLLEIRRRELEQYLIELKQPWREDSSNADVKFTRNRVRQVLVPLLESEFNPAVADSLAELAEIARGEEDYWENEISGWLGTVVQWAPPAAEQVERESLIQIQPSPGQRSPCDNPQQLPPKSQEATAVSISRAWLLTEPVAAQRRLVKAVGGHIGISLEFRHVEEIVRFAAENGPSGKQLSLPRGWRVAREQEALVFRAPDPRPHKRMRDYQYQLPLPGRAVVPEAGIVVEALRLPPKWKAAEYNPQQLLSAELLPAELTVRNWRPGDRFWPAQTKAPKKIKELLTERHIAQAERELWPVALDGEQIVWMRGFPVPAKLRAQPEREAVLIRETPWAEGYAI